MKRTTIILGGAICRVNGAPQGTRTQCLAKILNFYLTNTSRYWRVQKILQVDNQSSYRWIARAQSAPTTTRSWRNWWKTTSKKSRPKRELKLLTASRRSKKLWSKELKSWERLRIRCAIGKCAAKRIAPQMTNLHPNNSKSSSMSSIWKISWIRARIQNFQVDLVFWTAQDCWPKNWHRLFWQLVMGRRKKRSEVWILMVSNVVPIW